MENLFLPETIKNELTEPNHDENDHWQQNSDSMIADHIEVKEEPLVGNESFEGKLSEDSSDQKKHKCPC